MSRHHTTGHTITNTNKRVHTITHTQIQTHIFKPTIRDTQLGTYKLKQNFDTQLDILNITGKIGHIYLDK